MQTRLLRVLQEREIRPVGETLSRKIDVRVITATNKSLKDEVKAGRFREDLYFRLNVVTIKMPPLRERGDDIDLLIDHFLQKFAEKTGKKLSGISNEARQALRHYPWPGNVRELENTIERAVIMAGSQRIEKEDLRLEQDPATFKDNNTLRHLENQLLLKTVPDVDGNRTRAAKMMGLSTRWNQMRLKKRRQQEGMDVVQQLA